MTTPAASRRSDRGSILPMALVATVVLGLVVAATATYVSTTLRYGQVVESRADRISAAQGALDDTLEQLRVGSETPCKDFDSISRPFTSEINGITPTITCGSATPLLTLGLGWALAVTGENASGDMIQFGNSQQLPIDGPVFVNDPTRLSIGTGGGSKEVVLGPSTDEATHDAYYPCSGPSDPDSPQYTPASDIPDVIADQTYCINQTWEDLFLPGPTLALPAAAPDPPFRDFGACRVFWPGAYDDDPATPAPPLNLAASNYFLSGSYLFSGLGDIGNGSFMTFGRVDRSDYPGSSVGSGCMPTDVALCETSPLVAPDPATWSDARHAFCNDPNLTGAVVYLDGDTTFDMAKKEGGLDISGAAIDEYTVSIQSTCTTAACGRPIITKSGAGGGNDELNFSTFGLVYAPYDSVGVAQVPASSGLGFQGGLVIGSIAMNMSGGGVIVRAAGGDGPVELIVEATAADDSGSNTVRAIVEYVGLPEPDVAVRSRRVLDGS